MCHGTLYQIAAVKSMATHTVRCGDFRWLKHVSMSVVSWSRADVRVSGSEAVLIFSW